MVVVVNEVDVQDVNCLLLQLIVVVEYVYMQYEVIGVFVWCQLKVDIQLVVVFDGLGVVDGGYGVCKNKKVGIGLFIGQVGMYQVVFVVEYFVQVCFVDIMAGDFFFVDFVGVGFVISGYCFGNCVCCSVYLKEVVGDFLIGFDFGKSVIDGRV